MSDSSQIIDTLPPQKTKNGNKKNWKARKELVRREFLSKIPKGGVAVEVGVWKGEFSETILEVIKPKSLTLIDLWAHIEKETHSTAFVGRSDNKKMDRIYNKIIARYKARMDAGTISVIRDFSVNALKQFPDNSINFAYVDGDHSYDGVKSDLEALFPKMKSGGVMAFDDYHRRGWWGDDVIRAINDFLGMHPRELRILSVVGAQIGIQKLAPLVSDESDNQNTLD